MAKRSDIAPLRARLLSVLYMVALTGCLLFVANSCKNRDKGNLPQEEQTGTTGNLSDSSAISITQLDQLNLSKVNTKDYFLGEIDGKPYVLKLKSADGTQVQGKFYPIDSTRSTVAPVAFTIQCTDSVYTLSCRGKSSPVRFAIVIDSAAISGAVTTLGDDNCEHRLAFRRYRAPVFSEAKSIRYREPQYPFTKVTNIQYGKAKGFWTSYPAEDESNYAKIILKLLPKTVATKKLDLHLDLYLPDDSAQSHPLFVLLHGGAFFFGDKGDRNMREWCEHFAKCGYVVASVNYRMGFAISKSSIQQCGYQAIQDAHAALRFLVAHAEEYRIDPDHIFLAGTSAGSITALATTFMNDGNCPPFVAKNKLAKKCGSLHTADNEYRNKVKIKALANMWGAVYDLHELDGHHIPVVSFHGTDDQIVPFDRGFPFSGIKSNLGEKMFDEMYGSQSIHRYLDSLHVRNKLYPLEGCGHAPHQEKSGALNEHYYFIQEKMQAFFYPELKTVFVLKHEDRDPQLFYLDDERITGLSWQAEGGLILDIIDNCVRVVWFEDAPKQLLRASGLNVIGVPFKQEWNPKKACS